MGTASYVFFQFACNEKNGICLGLSIIYNALQASHTFQEQTLSTECIINNIGEVKIHISKKNTC